MNSKNLYKEFTYKDIKIYIHNDLETSDIISISLKPVEPVIGPEYNLKGIQLKGL